MKMRLMLSASLLLSLSGCITYDYVDGGTSGGYYHGSPQVQRSYPYGSPSGYSYDPYGYGSYYGGYYGNNSRPVYRPPYNPPPRPPQHGHHPPPQGNGHVPPRPGNDGNGRPTRPPPPTEGSGKSPWRDMDQLQRPQPPRTPRPAAAATQPMQRSSPTPQSAAPARPVALPRSDAGQRPSQKREDRGVRQVEP